MQEFPVTTARDRKYNLDLDEKRDRLGAEGANRRERIQSAFQQLNFQCVTATLRLTGVSVSLGEVIRVSRGEVTSGTNRELIQGQMSALEAVARSASNNSGLETSLVLDVHRLSCPPAGGTFRRGAARLPISSDHRSPPELVPYKIDNLMQWLNAESVSQMYVAEKAALAFARLLDIAPFEVGNFRTAHLLLSYFSLSEDYPPFHLRFEDASQIRSDIGRAMRFDTEALVLRLSDALDRSLDFCLDAVMKASS